MIYAPMVSWVIVVLVACLMVALASNPDGSAMDVIVEFAWRVFLVVVSVCVSALTAIVVVTWILTR